MDDFEMVNAELLTLLGNLNDTMSIMEELEDSKKGAFYESIQKIIGSFRSLKELIPNVKGTIPLQVIMSADAGEDPRDCVKTLMENVQETRRQMKKKQEWLDHLKNSLDHLIELNFPGETYEFEKDETSC